MSDVVYLRPLDSPALPDDVQQMAGQAGACFDLHRVDWVQSFLATGGRRMLCWYRAPDAESVRIALRQLGSDVRAAWAAQLIGGGAAPASPAALPAEANVVAEFHFDPADRGIEAWQAALQNATGAATPLGGFVSTSGLHAVTVHRAVDAETVRAALIDAGAPPVDVWTCLALTPRR